LIPGIEIGNTSRQHLIPIVTKC